MNLLKALLLLVCFCYVLNAFSGERDSLFLALDHAETPGKKIEAYKELSQSYTGSNYDSLDYYANIGLNIAVATRDLTNQIAFWNLLGNSKFFRGSYDSCIYYYALTLEGSIRQNDSLKQAAMFNNIGLALTYQAKYDTAINILLAAKKLREHLNDPKISSTLNNLGNAYLNMEDYDRALPYLVEAAALKEKQNQLSSLSNTLNNIGIILKKQGKSKEAIDYYNKSLQLAVQFNDKNKQANAHNNLATLYQGFPESHAISEQHYLKAISIKSEIDDEAGLYNTYNNYANLLSDMGEYQKAIRIIEQAEALQARIGLSMYTADGSILKGEVLNKMGRYKEAYSVSTEGYQKKIEAINEDRNTKIAELEVQFNAKKREEEINRLQLEQQVNTLEIKKSRNLLVAIILGTAIILLLGTGLVFIWIKREKTERIAQELQIEALKTRLYDLQLNPTSSTISQMSIKEINTKLYNALTEREFSVLKLSLLNKSNHEIGEDLYISVSTVKYHLRNAYTKLGVSNRKEALAYVVKSV